MTFADITLKHGLMLAPMAGVTDSSMRRICAEHGCDYGVSEMVSAKALVYEQNSRPSAPAKTASLCIVSPSEKMPIAIQIFGSEPEFMAEAAKLLSHGSYRGFHGVMPAAIDINMGCPVKKVVSNGEGSALMKKPEKIYDIVSAVSKASALPVTVKIRAGWDDTSLNAPECAKAAESGGAAAVCVHARTREMFYTPGILESVIRDVKDAVRIPVFGNGDITDVESAMRMLKNTGCDGLAIARGSIGNPWIFEQISAAIDGHDVFIPSLEEQLEAALSQLENTCLEKGEKRGIAEVKFALAHYVKGKRGATTARGQLMSATKKTDITNILTDFFTSKE